MRAGLATRPADRMTRVVMMTTAAFAGVMMFGVALPLAVSSPYPTAGQGNWILPAKIAQPIAVPEQAAPATVADAVPAETSGEKIVIPRRSLVIVTALLALGTAPATAQPTLAPPFNATYTLTDLANDLSLTLGDASGATGWNAHHLRPASMSMPFFAGAAVAVPGEAGTGESSRGSGAPAAIHFSKEAIFSSGSFPVGGMRSSVSL